MYLIAAVRLEDRALDIGWEGICIWNLSTKSYKI